MRHTWNRAAPAHVLSGRTRKTVFLTKENDMVDLAISAVLFQSISAVVFVVAVALAACLPARRL